jgi:hypothetical protein
VIEVGDGKLAQVFQMDASVRGAANAPPFFNQTSVAPVDDFDVPCATNIKSGFSSHLFSGIPAEFLGDRSISPTAKHLSTVVQ